MARDGFYFLAPLAAGAGGAAWAGWSPAAWALAALALFVAFFFRDPPRVIPSEPGIVVAPADGRVVGIETEGAATRVSIFLSIFNVHVNRSPIAGQVRNVEYRKGRFRAAFVKQASAENERNTLTIEGQGVRIECSQIAGLVARRIVCRTRTGDTLGRGERFGLIRFGSRVDLRLPPGVQVRVRVGDTIYGGASVIGRITSEAGKRTA